MYQDPYTTDSVSQLSCHFVDDALATIQCMPVDVQPYLTHAESANSPDDSPLARVQSAVFQRVPSRSDFTEIQGTVLIDSARAPPADVIIVHSDNLPEAIMFHCDSRPSTASSVRSSRISLTDLEGTEDCCLETDTGGMVVFERVPSMEDCLLPQSPVGAECGELHNSETADKPLSTTQQITEEVEEHTKTLNMAGRLTDSQKHT